MDKDIIIIADEYTTTKNDIEENIKFLKESIDSYLSLLDKLLIAALNDQAISQKIESGSEITLQKMNVLAKALALAVEEMTQQLGDIESADAFKFPHDIMSTISSHFSFLL